jgi:hypothetical protein
MLSVDDVMEFTTDAARAEAGSPARAERLRVARFAGMLRV